MADDMNKRPLIIRLTIDVEPKELRQLYSALENECLPFEAFVGVPTKNTGGEREFSVEVADYLRSGKIRSGPGVS